MPPNEKTLALIEAARRRTADLISQAHRPTEPAQLPSSATISVLPPSLHHQLGYTDPMKEVKQETTTITIGRNTFDPYEMPGVGRANKEQAAAIKLFGLEGASGCLIGPAGTGKTTTMKALLNAAILSGRIPILSEAMAHKYLCGGLPGVYGGSFTRIATRNLRNNFPADLQRNVHTIHRLLEFEPEVFEVEDKDNVGRMKKVRIFKPTRNKFRSLDANLVVFVLDESSMIGYTRLYQQLLDAIHPQAKPQMLFIGDIAQIPPVMDDAVLGYKMLEFIPLGRCVELVQVYRHAGAIVNLANKIRVGVTIPNSQDITDKDGKKDYGDNRYIVPYIDNPRKLPFHYITHAFKRDDWEQKEDKLFVKEQDGSKVSIRFWKNRLDGEIGQLKALQNLGIYDERTGQKGFFIKEIESGSYDPMTDMILIPYNVSVGTIEMNRYIANYLGRIKGAEVHEVISGYQKHYFAVGDKIFYEREEAVITRIARNAMYSGREPQASSVTLNRWGHNTAGQVIKNDSTATMDDVEMLLNIDIGNENEDRKNQASHVIHVQKICDITDGEDDPEDHDKLSTAAELNGLLFGYALTIHKSQGSQWPKVYCVFHNSHNRNLQRELLYTAITRAQKELYIIAEPETFIQGVMSQHIQGNTLEEKAVYFKGKIQEDDKRNDLFNKGVGK